MDPSHTEKASTDGKNQAGADEAHKGAAAGKGPDAMDTDEARKSAQPVVHQEIDLEEKRRLDHLESMDKIEKEFSQVKDKLFQEKMHDLQLELQKIEDGSHELFTQRMKQLQTQKEEKIWAAEQWRQYQLLNINNVFEAEKKQADDEYDNDKVGVKEELIVQLQDRQRKMEEEKNTLNLTEAIAADVSLDLRLQNTRSLRRRGGKEAAQAERDRGRKKLNPPHINYTLKDTEVQEDLAAISKSYLPLGRDARGKANEIYSDKGILHYHDREFEKGSSITVQAAREPDQKENVVFSGVVTLVNPAEVHIKGGDGAKNKFALAQLRSGKFFIV